MMIGQGVAMFLAFVFGILALLSGGLLIACVLAWFDPPDSDPPYHRSDTPEERERRQARDDALYRRFKRAMLPAAVSLAFWVTLMVVCIARIDGING